MTTAIPIANSQPDIGSNKTSKIPRPNPIKHTPSVFFSAHNIIFYPPIFYINIIFSFLLLVTYLCSLFIPQAYPIKIFTFSLQTVILLLNLITLERYESL